MIAKDLIVLGNVRILGTLYAESSNITNSTASYSTRMIAADEDDTTEPTTEGEVLWYYE